MAVAPPSLALGFGGRGGRGGGSPPGLNLFLHNIDQACFEMSASDMGSKFRNGFPLPASWLLLVFCGMQNGVALTMTGVSLALFVLLVEPKRFVLLVPWLASSRGVRGLKNPGGQFAC